MIATLEECAARVDAAKNVAGLLAFALEGRGGDVCGTCTALEIMLGDIHAFITAQPPAQEIAPAVAAKVVRRKRK